MVVVVGGVRRGEREQLGQQNKMRESGWMNTSA